MARFAALAIVATVATACSAVGSQAALPPGTSDTLPHVAGRTATRQLIDRAIEDTMDQRWTRWVVTLGVEARSGGRVVRYRGAVDRTRREGNERTTYVGRGWLAVRALRNRAYVTSGESGWHLALAGRTWLRVEPGAIAGVGSFEDLDLAATLLSQMKDRTDVRATGVHEIDGRRLATYRFSLPAAPRRVPADQVLRVLRLTSVLSDGERTVTALVGIGTDGLVHYLQTDTTIGPPSDANVAHAESAVRYEASFFGFHTPVVVVEPPPTNTVDVDAAPDASGLVRKLQVG